jgi:hypothetical protein
VTLRRVDSRFLLPHPVHRAAVLGGIDGWVEGLERAGVSVAARPAELLDLAVAPVAQAREALALGARAVILEGRGGRAVGRAGLERKSYLPLPGPTDPLVFVPLGSGGPARYGFAQWAFAGSPWKVVRNRAAGALAGAGLLPPVRSQVTVGMAQVGPPFVVRAARDLGVPEDVQPLLLAGQGDDYSRATFLLFERNGEEPSWALKFARLPVRLTSFERERSGLELARETGGVVAARAPRWLGSFEAEGLQCTLESAARGRTLLALLRSSPRVAARKRTVGAVCDWLLEVARTTRAEPAALLDERRRLAEDVLPRWGVDPSLVDDLPEIPAVLQHNDLGSWNIVADAQGFTVLDWENAVRNGLPLWDLFYFLADAAAQLDGAAEPGERATHFERLFLGEAQSSSLLFAWTRALVEALEIPPSAVGAIATLCWLHHGVGGQLRAEETGDPRASSHVAFGLYAELAERWLRHPGLGSTWSAWRA